MAKDRTTISNQVSPIQTGNKTFVMYPNLRPAEEYKFAALVDGKIKAWLLDFSEGKEKILVTHNLDIKDIFYLVNNVRRSAFPEFSSTKIFGEPNERGMSIVTSISIKRQDVDKSGKPRNFPWTIIIQNGFGKRVKSQTGGYYMKGGSYVEDKRAYINLSDMDFLYQLHQVNDYIMSYKTYVSMHYLPKWLSSFESLKKEKRLGIYQSNAYIADRMEQSREEVQAPEMLVLPVSVAPEIVPETPVVAEEKEPVPPKQGEGKVLYKKILLDPSEKFEAVNKEIWKIKALTGGRTFWLYFEGRPSEEVILMRTKGELFGAEMNLFQNLVWFQTMK